MRSRVYSLVGLLFLLLLSFAQSRVSLQPKSSSLFVDGQDEESEEKDDDEDEEELEERYGQGGYGNGQGNKEEDHDDDKMDTQDKTVPEKEDVMDPNVPFDHPDDLPNHVTFAVYVALRPKANSIGYALGQLVNFALNVVDTLGKQKYRFLVRGQQNDAPILRVPKVDLVLKPYLSPDRYSYDAPRRWTWWKYEFTYDCFWHKTGTAFDNESDTQKVQEDVNTYLSAVMDLEWLRQDIMDELGFDVYQIQIVQPERPLSSSPTYAPFQPAPFPPPSDGIVESITPSSPAPSPLEHVGDSGDSPTMPPTTEPLDASSTDGNVTGQDDESLEIPIAFDFDQDWGWRRSVGIGLLLGTVLGTVCLSQLAGLRRTRQNRREQWGNLATEEGVDELLRISWKVKGSRIEIYDKKNVGYKDDDSMLIGGFEQREIVGAQITVTQQTSSDEMTPERSRRSVSTDSPPTP